MGIKITVLILSRPFFMLEWERTKHQLMRTDLRSRLYSLQMPEVDKEIVKATQFYMERLAPKTVFLDGSPASPEMEICSPEAAAKYVEKDYVGVYEDYRAKMAKEVGPEVVYLDEGFGKINHFYWSQKKCNEAAFLIDEMIRQSLEKENYALDAMEVLKGPESSDSKDIRTVMEELDRIFKINELVKAKTNALWVKGKDGFPISERFEIDFHENDQPVDSLLKDQKDVKKMDALMLEAQTHVGREDCWLKKSEERISRLPDDSQVMFIIEARYTGFDENSISFDPYKEFNLPEGSLVDWGVKNCKQLPVMKFHERLRKLGGVEVVDLTKDSMRKLLKNDWRI